MSPPTHDRSRPAPKGRAASSAHYSHDKRTSRWDAKRQSEIQADFGGSASLPTEPGTCELCGGYDAHERDCPWDYEDDACLECGEAGGGHGLGCPNEPDPAAVWGVDDGPPDRDAFIERYGAVLGWDAYPHFETMLARDAAAEVFREYKNPPPAEPPQVVSLTELLAEPDEPVAYRVDGLWPTGGRVVLAAKRKSGKSHLAANLIRSLVDDEPFLDQFLVSPVDRIVLIDNELGRGRLRKWFREQGIENVDAVDVIDLRGRVSAFDILTPAGRREWAERIGPADVLVFDCLRPALDALGLSEDKDAGRFLVALDALAAAAGIGEMLVVHHMGHSEERSRGDSRIGDWPDATWRIVLPQGVQEAEADTPRFFKVYGRDASLPESLLLYDHDTRMMTLGGGSRATVRTNEIEQSILDFVAAEPGCSQNAIEKGVTGDDKVVRAAVQAMVAGGRLRRVARASGRGGCHYLPEYDDGDTI